MTTASELLHGVSGIELLDAAGLGFVVFEPGEMRAAANAKAASLLQIDHDQFHERGHELFTEIYSAAALYRRQEAHPSVNEPFTLHFFPKGLSLGFVRSVLMTFFRLKDHVAASLTDYSRPTFMCRQASVMRQWFEYVFETTPAMMHSIDPLGQLIRVNEAWLANMGYARSEVIGKHVSTFMTEESRRRNLADLPRFWTQGLAKNLPFEFVAADGSLRDVVINSLATVDPEGHPMSLTSVSDMTTQRNIERALSAALEHQKEAAASKSAFLANLSRELRMPFGGLLGTLQMIAELTDDENIREFAGMGLGSANQLQRMFDDLLLFSRLEAGVDSPVFAPFKPVEVMRDVMALYALSAQEGGIELTCEAPDLEGVELLGDARRIRQALMNLVGNALKFTAKGSVRLAAFCDDERDDEGRVLVRFVVQDSGVGIEKKKLSEIFDLFTQLETPVRGHKPGTGLGLSMVDRLAKLMNGAVTVESRVGRGSVFTLALPLSPVDGTRTTQPDSAEELGPARRTPGSAPRPRGRSALGLTKKSGKHTSKV